MGKRCPKIWATSVFFKKMPKENNHHKGKKIPQSGHPVTK
jgi:hypothetical protein